MQLNEILEENSAKSISQKTNISEENINYLLNKEFDQINKVHALGFISIIEREFGADLTSLREEINAYHEEHGQKDTRVTVGTPMAVNKRKSKWFFLLILIALGYATWYFLTQYDKTHLNAIFPFKDESTIENTLEEKSLIQEGDLNIINVIREKWAAVTKVDQSAVKVKEAAVVVDDATLESTTMKEALTTTRIETQNVEAHTEVIAEVTADVEAEENATESTESIESTEEEGEARAALEKTEIFIIPVQRLWFGLIDVETKQRKHYSISEKFSVDVTEHAWLAATSSAPFSLDDGVEDQKFEDAKEHYFSFDRNGIKELSKAEYVALGGWDQW